MAVEAGLLPSLAPAIELHSALPSTLTSFALSLLLVFRTNSSYSRWLDARWVPRSWRSALLMALALLLALPLAALMSWAPSLLLALRPPLLPAAC